MPHSFSVRVTNDIGPVVGLKLKVSFFKYAEFEKLSEEEQRAYEEHPAAAQSKFEVVLAEATTDSTGTAILKVAETGVFTLAPDTPVEQLSWVDVDVSDRPSFAVVELKWPETAILSTRHLRGRLTKGLYSSRSLPLNNTALKLHSLVEYKEIAATNTTTDGSFDFPDVPPGLYFLQILPTTAKTDDLYKPEGNVAIYVTANSKRESLAISTVNTSCGLSYDLEENKDRYKPTACFKGGKQVECQY